MNLSRHHSFLLALAALVLCAVMATPASAEQRASSVEAPVAQAAASCGNSDAVGGEVSERALESSTVCLLNRERASRGLRALRVNRRLSAAAQRHTDDMVRRRYFAHNSRSGASS
ncbi:MAG: CAP domain-containing protein, partial [Thermoleophilaceae bacterium]